MRLAVFGATGRCLLGQALDAGHEVTGVVRNPARLGRRHERLRVLRADVLDPAAMKTVLAGTDAAVSALGPRSYRAPTTVCSAGTASILGAMQATGVRRFVCVSAAPVAIGDPGDEFLYRLAVRPLLRRLLENSYDDMALMEEVRRSGLDWTILRPPRLTDGPPTGRYRTALGRNVPGGYSVSRADLNDAILRRLDDPGFFGATVGVGY